MTNYFESVQSIDELKKEYKRLARKNHPDVGGDTEVMKEINRQYEEAFKALNTDNKFQMSDGFREVIDAIINLEEINIEICGQWLWISGNTYAVKSELKTAGFMWASKKQMWYWRPEEAACHGKKGADMESIREKYGSKLLKGFQPAKVAYIA